MADIKINIDTSGVKSGTKVIKKSYEDIGKATKELVKSTASLENTFKEMAKNQSIMSRGFASTAKSVKSLKDASNGAATSLTALNTASKSIGDNFKLINSSVAASNKQFKKTEQTVGQVNNILGDMAKTFSQASRGFASGARKIKDFNDEIKATKASLNNLSTSLDEQIKLLQRETRALVDASNASEDLDDSTRRAARGAGVFTVALGNLAASGIQFLISGLSELPRILKEVSDEWLAFTNKINVAVSSQEDLAVVQSKLFNIAQETRTPLKEQATLFNRLSIAQKDLGASSEQILQVIKGVGQALGVTSTSTLESRGALIQLSQAFGQGIVRAEEFNSIMEGAPRIALALADGFGVTRAAMRSMVLEGKVTSREFFEAFLSQTELLGQEFSGVAITIDQSLNNLRNSFVQLVGRFNEITGASASVAATFIQISDVVTFLTPTVILLGKVTGDLYDLLKAIPVSTIEFFMELNESESELIETTDEVAKKYAELSPIMQLAQYSLNIFDNGLNNLVVSSKIFGATIAWMGNAVVDFISLLLLGGVAGLEAFNKAIRFDFDGATKDLGIIGKAADDFIAGTTSKWEKYQQKLTDLAEERVKNTKDLASTEADAIKQNLREEIKARNDALTKIKQLDEKATAVTEEKLYIKATKALATLTKQRKVGLAQYSNSVATLNGIIDKFEAESLKRQQDKIAAQEKSLKLSKRSHIILVDEKDAVKGVFSEIEKLDNLYTISANNRKDQIKDLKSQLKEVEIAEASILAVKKSQVPIEGEIKVLYDNFVEIAGKRTTIEKEFAKINATTTGIETKGLTDKAKLLKVLIDLKNKEINAEDTQAKQALKRLISQGNQADALIRKFKSIDGTLSAAELFNLENLISISNSGKQASIDLQEQYGEAAKQTKDANDKALDSSKDLLESYKDRTKEAAKALKDQQADYDKFLKATEKETASVFKDIFNRTIDDFEDFTDRMLSLFVNMLAEMAAKAIAEPIIAPIVQQISGGVSSLFGGGGANSGIGLGDIFSVGKSLLSGDLGNIPKLFGSAGNIFSAAGPTVAQTGIIQGGGSLAEAASIGTGGNLGGASLLTSSGLFAGAALGIIGGIASKIFSKFSEKDLPQQFLGFEGLDSNLIDRRLTGTRDTRVVNELGGGTAQSELFDFKIRAFEFEGKESEIQASLISYFDTIFTAVDDLTATSLNDVLKEHNFSRVSAGGKGADLQTSIESVSKGVFSDLLGELLLSILPDEGEIDVISTQLIDRVGSNLPGIIDRDTITRIDAGDDLLSKPQGAGRDGFESRQKTSNFFLPVEEEITRQASAMAELFNVSFFEAITPEGGNEWDALIGFAQAVENTDNFIERLTGDMEKYNQTLVDSFEDIQTISTALTGIDAGIEAITKTGTQNIIDDMVKSWADLTLILTEAHATTSELAEVERGRNIALGTQLTGLTASSLEGVVASGGDITSTVKSTVTKALAGTVAETIATDFIVPLNEEIGKAYLDSSGDLEAVLAILGEADFSTAQSKIDEFTDAIDTAFDETTDTAEELADALKTTAALEAEYAGLIGDTVELRRIAIEGMSEENVLLFDRNELYKQQSAISDERLGLEKQLLEAQNDTTALRQLELNALNESNRPLQEAIWEIEDLAAAAEETAKATADAAKAADESARAAESLATQMNGIDYDLATLGMSSFEKSIYDLGIAFKNNITSAKEVGASQADLTKISNLYNRQLQGMLSDITDNIQAEIDQIGMTDLQKELDNIDREYQDNVDQIDAIERAMTVTEAGFNVVDTISTQLDSIESILISIADKTDSDLEDITDRPTSFPTDSFGNIVGRVLSETELPEGWAMIEVTGRNTYQGSINTPENAIYGFPTSDVGIFGRDYDPSVTAILEGLNRIAGGSGDIDEPIIPTTTAAGKAKKLRDARYEESFGNFFGGIQTELEQFNMTDLEREIANINIQFKDSINDLGTFTERGIVTAEQEIEATTAITAIRDAQLQAIKDVEDARRKDKSTELTIRRLELEGDAQGALNLQREIELESLRTAFSGTSKVFEDMLTHIFKLEDLATATAAYVSALDKELADFNKDLQELKDNVEDARSAYIDGLQREIDKLENIEDKAKTAFETAESAYAGAIDGLISENEGLIDVYSNLGDSIRDYKSELLRTDRTFTPKQRLGESRSQLLITSAGLSGTSEERQKSLTDLPGVGSSFLEASRRESTSLQEYQRDLFELLKILDDAEAVAESSKTIEEQSLATLKSTLTTITGVDETTQSIETLSKNYYDAKEKYDVAKRNSEESEYRADKKIFEKTEKSVTDLKKAYDDAQSLLTNSTLPLQIKQHETLLFALEGVSKSIDELKAAYETAAIAANKIPVTTPIVSTRAGGGEPYHPTPRPLPPSGSGSFTLGDTISDTPVIAPVSQPVTTLDELISLGTPLAGDTYQFTPPGMDNPINIPTARILDYEDVIRGQVGFATGGTISGSADGYTVPTTFHGVEHITPDSQMTAVKEVLAEIHEVLFMMLGVSGDTKEIEQAVLSIMKRNTQGGTNFKVEVA